MAHSFGEGKTWVIVLAGGDGRRLEAVARERFGHARPKQFCDFGAGTLLARTLDRAARITTDERTIVVTTRAHRAFADECLDAYPLVRRAEQPRNLDTTPGILHPLLKVLEADPGARVAILPSDHHVERDWAFASVVREALGSLEEHPDDLLMIGAPAAGVEDGYGWIVPAGGVGPRWGGVATFREKPPLHEIPALAAAGALRNTFVLVARAQTLVSMVAENVPSWHEGLTSARGPADVERVYNTLPASNFSHDVLERARERLRVVPLGDVGWDDIGTPERLSRALRMGGRVPREIEYGALAMAK